MSIFKDLFTSGAVKPGKPMETSDATFDNDILKSELPVLLDFWSPTCMPCQVMGGLLRELYGSAHTEKLPLSSWQVGLATAPSLAGPWKRCSDFNPLKVESRFIENPIVQYRSRLGRETR